MSDPGKYRTKEEVDSVRNSKDPIERLRIILISKGVTEKEIEDIEEKVKAEVLRAVEFSDNSPEPDESELWTDVLLGESA
jgi:pyruvate dehydrogenase E1 component alpha subunit